MGSPSLEQEVQPFDRLETDGYGADLAHDALAHGDNGFLKRYSGTMLPQLPRPLIYFGLAGLLPQAVCLVLACGDGESHWFALAAGCCYAAIILSFLGGLWWMAALLAGLREPWIYGLAVMPSLAGWAALLPWCIGWRWPGPSLVALGLVLLASPLVDILLARRMSMPPGWLRLRGILACGLGGLTLAIAATG